MTSHRHIGSSTPISTIPLVSITSVRLSGLSVSVSSRDSPHVPDVYLDAGPHPHQSRLSAGRSLSDIIGFDHAGVCETSAKTPNFLHNQPLRSEMVL